MFKDIPLDQLSKNKGFQAHSANVMRAFSSIFDYIHDPELIEASILSLAERHKIRGQKREQFEVINSSLVALSSLYIIVIALDDSNCRE